MIIAPGSASAFRTLSQTLWRQHGLLELLLYRMEVQRLVLETASGQWAEMASDDVESTMDALREEELVRAAHVAKVAEVLGVDAAASLRDLVAAAPEPWADILRDHQRSFLELVERIEATSKANRDLLRHSLRLTRDMLRLGADASGGEIYDRSGSLPVGRTKPVLVDRDA